jgi:hypothetical protein
VQARAFNITFSGRVYVAIPDSLGDSNGTTELAGSSGGGGSSILPIAIGLHAVDKHSCVFRWAFLNVLSAGAGCGGGVLIVLLLVVLLRAHRRSARVSLFAASSACFSVVSTC